ncbi:MAG TPA: DoxX family protein [Haliangiales bacterium]|nr:DoxX family protein [Haliangiales bacterium]
MEFGLLILRAVVGLTLAGHGVQKLFGWFGGYGLAGTGGFFEQLGLRPGRLHAFLAGATEAGAGLLLALGFLTPVAAAGLIAVMIVAAVSVHWKNGFWVTKQGYEYPFIIAAAAAALAFTGPGRLSVDALLGLDLAGWTWGLAALAAGFVGGIVPLMTRVQSPEVSVR